MTNHLSLYLLKRNERTGYDEVTGSVIAALSPDHARRIASGDAGDEGGATWLDESRTSCDLLATGYQLGDDAGVVFCDFRAG